MRAFRAIARVGEIWFLDLPIDIFCVFFVVFVVFLFFILVNYTFNNFNSNR